MTVSHNIDKAILPNDGTNISLFLTNNSHPPYTDPAHAERLPTKPAKARMLRPAPLSPYDRRLAEAKRTARLRAAGGGPSR
jgi:hypothetical protein